GAEVRDLRAQVPAGDPSDLSKLRTVRSTAHSVHRLRALRLLRAAAGLRSPFSIRDVARARLSGVLQVDSGSADGPADPNAESRRGARASAPRRDARRLERASRRLIPCAAGAHPRVPGRARALEPLAVSRTNRERHSSSGFSFGGDLRARAAHRRPPRLFRARDWTRAVCRRALHLRDVSPRSDVASARRRARRRALRTVSSERDDVTAACALRVLHVSAYFAPAFRYGGPPRTIFGLCPALATAGANIEVFTTTAKGDEPLPAAPDGITYEGLRVRYFPLASPSIGWRATGLAAALASEARRADLVHVHGLWNLTAWAGVRAARVAGVPYV